MKGSYQIWGWSHLGHVAKFKFDVSKSLHINMVKIAQSFLRKARFSYVNGLAILSFAHSVVCIYHIEGHWIQYVLKNPLFLLFPIEKPKSQSLTLSLIRSRSTHGHHLNKL